MHRFLIVIPSYNEEKNIARVLEELLQLRLDADILVVNDGSADRTAGIARQYPVNIVSHPCNLGYGAALQTGYKYAVKIGYEYVLQFDADGQHNPLDLIDIMNEMDRGDVDIVMGSRYIERQVYSAGAVKMTAVLFFRWLIYMLTKVKIADPTSGLRGITRRVFQYYAGRGRFPADFPDADMLIHMILRNYRIREIPAHMRERQAGLSMHAGLKPIFYIVKMTICILLVIIRSRSIRSEDTKEGVEA
jgi:hypothetical protein